MSTKTTTPHSSTVDEQCQEPSLSIIIAVAEAQETDPCTLPPLIDTIDPEAIDALLCNPPRGLRLTFEYAETTVSIHDTGEITVQVSE